MASSASFLGGSGALGSSSSSPLELTESASALGTCTRSLHTSFSPNCEIAANPAGRSSISLEDQQALQAAKDSTPPPTPPRFLHYLQRASRFDTRLRSIELLCGHGYRQAVNKLHRILMTFRRPTMVIQAEKEEAAMMSTRARVCFGCG